MRFAKIAAVLLVIMATALIAFVYVAPERALRIALEAQRQQSGLVHREIDLPDGMHYVYLEGGQGESMLLLHGFGGDKDNFTRVAKYLTPHYHVIIPDHIGFGESAHPPKADYSPVAQAARLHALSQALHLDKPHLGGNSMGGQIALSYAALYPADAKSLWLLDPAGIWSAPESELGRITRETGRNPLLTRTEDEFAGLFAFVMSDPPFIPRPMLDVMAQARIRNFELEQKYSSRSAMTRWKIAVPGLATPTLIVWGGKDRLLNVGTADILYKLMPHSEVDIMPEAGHLPMLEKPQQSAERYLRFLSLLKIPEIPVK